MSNILPFRSHRPDPDVPQDTTGEVAVDVDGDGIPDRITPGPGTDITPTTTGGSDVTP